METTGKNGSGSLTYRWLAGILVTVLLAATVGWARDTSGRLSDAERANTNLAERLARIEAQVQAVDARTARIESKLDNLGARP